MGGLIPPRSGSRILQAAYEPEGRYPQLARTVVFSLDINQSKVRVDSLWDGVVSIPLSPIHIYYVNGRFSHARVGEDGKRIRSLREALEILESDPMRASAAVELTDEVEPSG